jgi:hypothetical protein
MLTERYDETCTAPSVDDVELFCDACSGRNYFQSYFKIGNPELPRIHRR